MNDVATVSPEATRMRRIELDSKDFYLLGLIERANPTMNKSQLEDI
jgi:hypothetical protein